MAIEILGKESSKEKIDALVDFLIREEEFPAQGSKRSDVEAFVRRVLRGDTATRIMVLHGKAGKARACGLFSLLTGLRGDWLWIHEVLTPDDDEKAAVELCEGIQKWAKDAGCDYIATATTEGEAGERELAVSFGLTESPVLWMEGSLR